MRLKIIKVLLNINWGGDAVTLLRNSQIKSALEYDGLIDFSWLYFVIIYLIGT